MARTQERLYRIFYAMKTRCYNPHHKSYPIYGGRGITVCDEWRNNYDAFKEWALENGYNDDLTIDRIDANGNYEPMNCRWLTMQDQILNKRNSKTFSVGDETLSLHGISVKYNIPVAYIKKKLNDGLDINKIIQSYRPKERHNLPNNIRHILNEMSQKTGISYQTLSQRFKNGVPFNDLVNSQKNKIKYKLNNREYSINELSDLCGMSRNAVRYRMDRYHCKNLSELQSAHSCKQYNIDGTIGTIHDLCKTFDICEGTVRKRLRDGWNIYDAITKPVDERFINKKYKSN